MVQTCFHRHFLTRLPLFEANFLLIQPITCHAERAPASDRQNGGHCTQRHKG
ncbi:Uncharacterized protein AC517_0634 [Pseudomonas syringae pv. syringae]|nr:Uncharacterized protein AC517_0634 [Pseudomonas syringae pv. syringae]